MMMTVYFDWIDYWHHGDTLNDDNWYGAEQDNENDQKDDNDDENINKTLLLENVVVEIFQIIISKKYYDWW